MSALEQVGGHGDLMKQALWVQRSLLSLSQMFILEAPHCKDGEKARATPLMLSRFWYTGSDNGDLCTRRTSLINKCHHVTKAITYNADTLLLHATSSSLV